MAERVKERQARLCDCQWGGGISAVESATGDANPWHTKSKQCPSAPELTFWRLIEASGLPLPVREHRFHPVRRWRFDMAWVEHLIAVEIDGGNWQGGRHARAAGIDGDHEKMNTAQGMGWRIFRYTPGMLKKDPDGVVAQIRTALLGGSGYAAETQGVDDPPAEPTPMTLNQYLAWYADKDGNLPAVPEGGPMARAA